MELCCRGFFPAVWDLLGAGPLVFGSVPSPRNGRTIPEVRPAGRPGLTASKFCVLPRPLRWLRRDQAAEERRVAAQEEGSRLFVAADRPMASSLSPPPPTATP